MRFMLYGGIMLIRYTFHSAFKNYNYEVDLKETHISQIPIEKDIVKMGIENLIRDFPDILKIIKLNDVEKIEEIYTEESLKIFKVSDINGISLDFGVSDYLFRVDGSEKTWYIPTPLLTELRDVLTPKFEIRKR